MIKNPYGKNTVKHIENMTKYKIKRKHHIEKVEY